MENYLVETINLLGFLALLSFPFLPLRKLTYAAFFVLSIQLISSTFLVYHVFANGPLHYDYAGSFITGSIHISIDYLSVWFIMMFNFSYLTGALYGLNYLKKYSHELIKLRLHAIAYVLSYIGLFDICIVQNGFVFLVVWELMAISSFLLVIFEYNKIDTLKSGINYFIQSHIAILFLTIAFIVVKINTGSFSFDGISAFTTQFPEYGIGLFLLFFIGFGIKAGFVPFHTWLPLAHPVAPSHISGLMSGVIIKIGIFGILRILTSIHGDYIIIGVFILVVSIITGVYGVSMAIMQNNIKRLLAYSSIENIGIIGLGMGVGCLGKASGNELLILLGFGGALLHALNHSFFKSLLFFLTGIIYQSTHTLDINHLGGLIKKIPRAAFLFLLASLAICGFPPFNGFISEFIIYKGFVLGFELENPILILVLLFAILALALIGGLALMAFTKAFSTVFLGIERHDVHVETQVENRQSVFPLYLIASAIVFVGVFPMFVLQLVIKASSVFLEQGYFEASPVVANIGMVNMGFYPIVFLLLLSLLFFIRKYFNRANVCSEYETWVCGYVVPIRKAQYTGHSFARSFSQLFRFQYKRYTVAGARMIGRLYPVRLKFFTESRDLWEYYLIMPIVNGFSYLLNKFKFLQNGNIQYYILYGFIFITLAFIFHLFVM